MRNLATIEHISDLRPHPNADSLELATVRGWQICVKKGEFRAGDRCVYCEIDSVLPDRPEFEFLRDRKFRIKTIRLRGELSQGICFPLSVLPTATAWADAHQTDVTQRLGVTLYQPPMPTCLGGDVVGPFPSFIPKTDTERIQNVDWIFQECAPFDWAATEKLDGCFERGAYLPLWNGGSITMGEIVIHGKRPTIIGMDSTGKLVPCEIANTFRNGKKTNWIDVFFNPVHRSAHVGKSGRLRVTKNHKIFLHSGIEVSAGDIQIGDRLISCEETPDESVLHYIKSSLLGDGSIPSKLGSNCKYSEGHKESHRNFCSYIEEILGDCFASKRILISGYGREIIAVTSRAYKALDRLRCEWYPEDKKILPANIDWIDDFSIAKLYMDDGSLSHSELQNDRANIATNGFNESDAKRIQAKIEGMYGVSTHLQESRGYYSIIINYSKGTIDNFWNAIAKHIHPDFKYKLPEKYRNTVFVPYPLGKKVLVPVPVEVTNIQEVPASKKNFPSGAVGFDLETTTHNYMCGGILVHNSSCTVFWKDDALHVCSRNWELKESDRNAFWQAARTHELADKLKGTTLAIQGELLGPGIQGNRYGIQKPTLYVFDVFDWQQRRYLDFIDYRIFCGQHDLEVVPLNAYLAKLKDLPTTLRDAEGQSDLHPCHREGVVWRPCKERTHPKIGRLMFKAISNAFLLKNKD